MATGPDLSADERLTVLGLLAETFLGLAGRAADQLAEHGMSGVEFEVLLRLSRSPERRLRMSDLSAQTSLTTSGTTRVVDRLCAADLVCRLACPDDRRSTYAVLTDLGQDRLTAALPGHLDLIQRWLVGPLTPHQLEGLVAALRVVRDGVRPGATAGARGTGAGAPDRRSEATAT
jgi:MarR family transcriptional regulator, 2-MHQ and catechol-resistance regulon repressor